MVKNSEMDNNKNITKQTLAGAIILSLLVGFLGGTIYSSFKLASDNKTQKQGIIPTDNNSMQTQQNASIQIASKIMKLEQYLKEHPQDGSAWAQLGNQFFDTDQYVNAIDAYEKSLQLEPGKIGVITDLGVMYRRNKQPEKAIEFFEKAIAIDPEFEIARFNKGIVLLHDLNDTEGGISAWEKIVEINPMAMAPNGESVDALIRRMKKQ